METRPAHSRQCLLVFVYDRISRPQLCLAWKHGRCGREMREKKSAEQGRIASEKAEHRHSIVRPRQKPLLRTNASAQTKALCLGQLVTVDSRLAINRPCSREFVLPMALPPP